MLLLSRRANRRLLRKAFEGSTAELSAADVESIRTDLINTYIESTPASPDCLAFVPWNLDQVANLLSRHYGIAESIAASRRKFRGDWQDSLVLQVIMHTTTLTEAVREYLLSVSIDANPHLLVKAVSSMLQFSHDDDCASLMVSLLERSGWLKQPSLVLWANACLQKADIVEGYNRSPELLMKHQLELTNHLFCCSYEENVAYSYALRNLDNSISLIYPSFFLLLELFKELVPLEFLDSLAYVASPAHALRPYLPDIVHAFSDCTYPLVVAASRREYYEGLQDELATIARDKLSGEPLSSVLAMLYRDRNE